MWLYIHISCRVSHFISTIPSHSICSMRLVAGNTSYGFRNTPIVPRVLPEKQGQVLGDNSMFGVERSTYVTTYYIYVHTLTCFNSEGNLYIYTLIIFMWKFSSLQSYDSSASLSSCINSFSTTWSLSRIRIRRPFPISYRG